MEGGCLSPVFHNQRFLKMQRKNAEEMTVLEVSGGGCQGRLEPRLASYWASQGVDGHE